MTKMGYLAINPVCDIAGDINRGSFAVDTFYDNRLGESVGVMFRNGINSIISPVGSKRSADGVLDITVVYRCQGHSQLNQFYNFLERNPHLADKYREVVKDDTSVRLLYRIRREDLVNSDAFYIDDLDITLTLNPLNGLGEHARVYMQAEEAVAYKKFIDESPLGVKVSSPYVSEKVRVLFGGRVVEVPNEPGATTIVATTYSMDQKTLKVEEIPLDGRHVWYSEEAAKLDESLAKSEDNASGGYGHYYTAVDKRTDDSGGVGKEIGKELTNLVDAYDKAVVAQRSEQLARLKHTQAVVGDTLKLADTTAKLGAKILDIIP